MQTSGLNRAGCGDAQPAEDLMSLAQGCLLSRAVILTNLPRISEQEVLEQRLGSGQISKGGSRRSDAGGPAA